MSDLKKWPIPEGFVWNYERDTYVHPDGRTWDSRDNVIHDPRNAALPDPRQIEGGGPRILSADIEEAIKQETFHVDGTLTICILTLQNGFRVTGESACADPANFNEAKGRELAGKQAREKIWPLLGYVLRNKLHQEQQS
jgi:hypothetical protein